MAIRITRQDNRIVVSDGTNKYSVAADTQGQNQFGHEAGMTWGEAYEANRLSVQDDDEGGHSHGMHGSLYVS